MVEGVVATEWTGSHWPGAPSSRCRAITPFARAVFLVLLALLTLPWRTLGGSAASGGARGTLAERYIRGPLPASPPAAATTTTTTIAINAS